MRLYIPKLSLLLVWLAFVACAPQSVPDESVGSGTGEAAMNGPLVTSLTVEPRADSIHFRLQVTNSSSQPVELTFPSGQSFDFVVARDGREIWRWSADQMFTQALRMQTLAPGETLEFSASWAPPAGLEGELQVAGMLTTMEPRVEQHGVVRLP